MTPTPHTACLNTPLTEVTHQLASRRISAVPVLDARGSIVGVVSRSDLLHHRRVHPHAADTTCGAIMTQGPIVVEATAPLREAARLMIEHRIHRVFVVTEGRLEGVLSTTDLTRAVEDAKVDGAINTVMSTPVATIRVDQGLALAIEWLDRAHISGLIVTENDWPVGVFTQEEALAARDLPPTTQVGDLLDPSLICLPFETSLHRAAAQCARMDVRRIVVSKQRDFVGVVSGLDFAGVVARA
ncbi:MAG: CBS domain-containing protein [Kofleriaceae bacterium]